MMTEPITEKTLRRIENHATSVAGRYPVEAGLDIYFLVAEIRRSRLRDQSLTAMLRNLQWGSGSKCPRCGGVNPVDAGREAPVDHAQECDLQLLLKASHSLLDRGLVQLPPRDEGTAASAPLDPARTIDALRTALMDLRECHMRPMSPSRELMDR